VQTPCPTYEGDDPYVFVVYAHEDASSVYPELKWLHQSGLNLWYDDGITAGENWRAVTGAKIALAAHILFYVSRNSIGSIHCNREINFALDQGLHIVPVYLEKVDLTLDLKIGLARVQAVSWDESRSFREKLLKALRGPASEGRSEFVADFGAAASTRGSIVPGHHGGLEVAGKPSIVVLPFRNLSGPEVQVLAEGLTYDITTRIGRTRSVLVTARGTAFKLWRGDHDVKEVGQLLGVRYVCHGSVQISAHRLRVNVSVAQTLTGEEIWAQTYDEKLDDFMLVQERIAAQVVSAVDAEIEQMEQRQSLLVPSANLDAWSAFHQGCWYMYRFRKEHIADADRLFSQSIDLEPTVPRPYAGLSFVRFQRAFLGLSKDRAFDIEQAHELALRALELDPRDPMGFWALSRARLIADDLTGAESALSNAIKLNPSYAVAIYTLGWVYMHLGNSDGCIEQIERARRLSPLDPLMFAMLGVQSLNMALMGRTEESVELARMAVRQPNVHGRAYSFCALSHAIAGDWNEASRLMEHTWSEDPTFGIGGIFEGNPFQRQQDIAIIKNAFKRLEARRQR
jgi:TolB-like protein